MHGSSETVRAFVCVDIGDAVRASLAADLAGLRRRWPHVKWVTPENVHLTLAFLGNVYPEQVEAVGRVMAGVARGTSPFTLTFEGLGYFGPARSPRVVWVGAAGDTATLVAMQAALADGLRQAGFTPEDRPFAPHLTIGRVKAAGDAIGLAAWLSATGGVSHGSLTVNAIRLMRSELRPSGPIYTVLKEAALEG